MVSGEIKSQSKNGQNFYCEIKVTENQTILEFPYIYYPGYVITINNKKVEGFESQNGFLSLIVDCSDSYKIHIFYQPTIAMRISYILSFISFIFYIFYNLTHIKKHPEN